MIVLGWALDWPAPGLFILYDCRKQCVIFDIGRAWRDFC